MPIGELIKAIILTAYSKQKTMYRHAVKWTDFSKLPTVCDFH